jgi:hypothetical protein
MNSKVIKLNKSECIPCHVQSNLSFRPLLSYLKNRLKTERSLKSEFYRFLIDKIEKEELLRSKSINVDHIANHKETLELIYTILTPLMAKDDDLYWALSSPIPDFIFFSTDAFHDFFQNVIDQKESYAPVNPQSLDVKHLKFIYRIILNRLYNFTSLIEDEVIYTYKNPKNNLTQFYHVNADTQFINVLHKGALPELNFEHLASNFKEEIGLEYLTKVLPLSNFVFEGFTVISLVDVTITQSIAQIRNALVEHNYQTETYSKIVELLKILGGKENIEFGLIPFLKVNDRLVFDNQDFTSCKLIQVAKEFDLEEEVFYSLVEKYKENPRSIFIKSIDNEHLINDPLLAVLKKSGLASYNILPIFYNNNLAGIVEIFSNEEFVVDDFLLSRLQPTVPLIGQLFQYSIEDFESKMDSILKDKFTALQPSVQWRFNEAVYNYIRNNKNTTKRLPIETVSFDNMFPIFGAIDIRNSTIERNEALRDDIHTQLEILISTLTSVKSHANLQLISKLIFNCKEWMKKVKLVATAIEETALNEFLDLEVYPFLKLVAEDNSEVTAEVARYFDSIKPTTGVAFENRRKLEQAMQTINSEVSLFLDGAVKNLQSSYPCYFSKFRTDGVEYDIYIGQAIAPDKAFSPLYLKNIRLWQLTTMAEIARITYGLQGNIPKDLQTTQLIFVHSNPIDISFRNDERRFDVEGAYNIRYEVVKKRIDKVLIKNTNERLTQPNKISMVYFNSEEAKEYTEYIKYLQDQGFLNDDLEKLDLEELQGVIGLKALRVGVKYT